MRIIEKLLRAKKMKVTPQRIAVYGFLYGNRDHPDLDQIYEHLSHDYPDMSLAVVYKTINALKESGLVNELNVGEGEMRYDAEIRPHSHIYCTKCGRIVDLPHDHFTDGFSEGALLSKVKEQTGYDISGLRLFFNGLCPQCKEASSNEHQIFQPYGAYYMQNGSAAL